MTKITYVSALASVIPTVEDNEIRAKLESLKSSLERKSVSSGNRKPTATQIANEGHKQTILNSMERGRLYTITEMTKEFNFSAEVSVNKCSAIIKQMVQSNLIERVEDKRKAYFRLI